MDDGLVGLTLVGVRGFDPHAGHPCCWCRHEKLPFTNGGSRGPAARQAVEGTVLPVRFRDRSWVASYRRDSMSTQNITREVPIQECLNGKTREESNMDDDAIEAFVNMTKDIERSQALRELAKERLDEDELPEATTLLWIDAAEVYSLCSGCYHENRDGQWTGSTQNPNQFELQKKMNERLEQGVPCSFCKSNRIKELKEEIDDEVDVEVEVVE